MLNKEIRVFVCVLLLKPSWLYLKKFKNSRGDTRHQRKLLKIDWNLKPNTRRLWGISFLYSSFINATWKENQKSSGDECLAPGSLKWEKQQRYRKSSHLATSFAGVCKLFGPLVLYHPGNLHITQDAEKGVRSFCKHNPKCLCFTCVIYCIWTPLRPSDEVSSAWEKAYTPRNWGPLSGTSGSLYDPQANCIAAPPPRPIICTWILCDTHGDFLRLNSVTCI